MDEIPDFSEEHKIPRFRIDGDVFTATTTPPAERLVEFAAAAEQTQDATIPLAERLSGAFDLLSGLLLEESATRFRTRLRDVEHPISMQQVIRVINYLLESYGRRPTQPSESYSPGPPDQASGTSSADGAPSQLSIPSLEPSTPT